MIDLLTTSPRLEGAVTTRDWATVPCSELISNQKLHFVDLDTPVEEACQVSHLSLFSADPLRTLVASQALTFFRCSLTMVCPPCPLNRKTAELSVLSITAI